MNKKNMIIAMVIMLPAWANVTKAHKCDKTNRVTCAIQDYIVPPGNKPMTASERSLLPPILRNHPYYTGR